MNIGTEAAICRQLWVNVLTRAMTDIFAPVTSMDRRRERDEAIAWIGTTDFYRVCAYALLDGTRVAAQVKRRLAQQETGEFDFTEIAPYARRYLDMEGRA